MSGTVAPCFSASARNCAASSRIDVAIERYIVRDPEAVEDREQQQRVFGRLSERFSLFDQQSAPAPAAALVSGAAYPLTWMSGVMSAT